jgi:hypothetical protein
MRLSREGLSLLIALAAALALAACGGKSPTGASGNGIVLQGTVLSGTGVGASDLHALSGTSSSSSRITVTVSGTGISTTVSASGTFELEGLSAGTFTLVFTKDGQTVGTLTLTVESPTAEVKLVVEVTDSGVVLVQLKIDDKDETGSVQASCLISGGVQGQSIELEGDVDSGDASQFLLDVGGQRAGDLVTVRAANASWVCVGKSGANCKDELNKGAHVHVRGKLTTCTTAEAEVDATEVKVQKP